MYSYEDRLHAVQLYIQLGKRVGPTIRLLGYPTKNALKGWYREYEQMPDLPAGYARRKQRYLQAQKEEAVEHYRTTANALRAPFTHWAIPVVAY
jgi:putative transposase